MSELRQLRSLEDENARLKRLVADLVIVLGTSQGRDSASATVLPLVGIIEVGSDAVDTGAMLRSGTITLLARTLLGHVVFPARTADVAYGDAIRISGDGEGVGVLVVNENPAMVVTFRGVGTHALVSRFGGQGYSVAAPLVTRLTADTELQVAWAVFGFIAIVESVLALTERNRLRS